MNIINYLTDENGLMESKTIKIRLLDNSKIAHNHTEIILINTVAVPPAVIILCGIAFVLYRRRKYSA
ncbi:MAG: hypothetical protein LBH90_00865 [Tannerella sp.]|jgi:hypothetical protein|nr:hypothetical protein [Tannerella sp.]